MSVRVDDQPKLWRVHADSLWEMLDWIKRTPRVWNQQQSKANNGDRSWDLGVGWDGAVRLANEGWEEGIRDLTATMGTMPSDTVYVQSFDMAGQLPDVPRFLGGDPRNMINRGRESKPKATMSIAFNMSAQADTRAQAIWNFGAALVTVIDRLESRKVRCEVTAVWHTQDLGRSRANAAIATTLKRPEDPLDLNAMAFGVAHPAMLRRIGFAAIERSRADMEDYGYGRPNSELSEKHLLDPIPGTLFIGGIGQAVRSCNTLENAVAYITKRINDAAGEDIVELEAA